MANKTDSRTKALFECLRKLYQQGQMLLLDADRLMGDKGWQCMHTTAPAGLSNSLNSPGRWYARWAARFYVPAAVQGEDISTDKLLFISVHFASDGDNEVDEPLVSAGKLIYSKPLSKKTLDDNYYYWMCKYWFWGKPHQTLNGWRQTTSSRYVPNLQATESFAVPLYDVTSSQKLEELVVSKLIPIDRE